MSPDFSNIDIKLILTVFGIFVGVSLGLAILLLIWVIWRVKRIQLPPEADFMTALQATPLAVVVLLDLLDLSLDFLSAPFAWVVLGYLGLKPLRGVTMVESLIPGTQVLPTMTAAWLFVRIRNRMQRSGRFS
jgi:hypothetical protein